MNTSIKIIDGEFKYNDTLILGNLNLEFAPNSISCILGESGCGKTTLLKILSGELNLTRGQILNSLHRGDFSIVYQDIRLLPNLSASQNIQYVLPKTISKIEKQNLALKMLEIFGLKNYSNFLPRELSGGMQKRVGLARALAFPSSVILLDEAFDSLDDENKNKTINSFLKIVNAENRTVICVTHDKITASKIANTIITLNKI